MPDMPPAHTRFSVGVVRHDGRLSLELGACDPHAHAQLPRIQRLLAENGAYSRLIGTGQSLRIALPQEKPDA